MYTYEAHYVTDDKEKKLRKCVVEAGMIRYSMTKTNDVGLSNELHKEFTNIYFQPPL